MFATDAIRCKVQETFNLW